jgi:N-acetylmuramoyl-L-alanine amidase
VLAHSDVAPDRKLDPGERFPWAALAAAGVGLWPAEPTVPADPERERAARLLARIGYPPGDGERGRFLALAAFQRRFRPGRVDGRLDPGTMGRLTAVAALYDAARGRT